MRQYRQYKEKNPNLAETRISEKIASYFNHSSDISRGYMPRNRGYNTHYHQSHTPSPKGTLPKARLPAHCTHTGGGCWIAYKKTAPWATSIRPLPIPGPCPSPTTCAIELTLHSGAKAAIIACYLPQDAEAHTQTCKALSNLPLALPNHVLILGGDF